MATKAQMQAELDDLRRQLQQERQDHQSYVQLLRSTAFEEELHRGRVKAVFRQRDGWLEAMPVVRIEDMGDGVNVIVV